MIWEKLKDWKCPKCTTHMLQENGMLSDNLTCTNPFCDFKIKKTKFEEIVARLYKKEDRSFDPDQRLSELNNLEL